MWCFASPAAAAAAARASCTHQVRVYDAGTEDGGGELFKELRGHENDVNCVAFSSAGVLASCSDDGTVIVWDLEKDGPLQVKKEKSTYY